MRNYQRLGPKITAEKNVYKNIYKHDMRNYQRLGPEMNAQKLTSRKKTLYKFYTYIR